MEIEFISANLAKNCNSEKESIREWGDQNAKRIRQRLAELYAAETLADVSKLPPPRCHELRGNRAGQFAVYAKHPYRLIFQPAHNPVPLSKHGGIDLNKVVRIRILEVEDYHGK